MTHGEEVQPSAAGIADAENLLNELLRALRQTTERPRAEELMVTLVDQALRGVVRWYGNVDQTMNAAIKAIDQKLSTQLAAVMHHPDFQKLEGTRRGLNYLVTHSETGRTLKIKILNVSKRELYLDLGLAAEFDQSRIFVSLYNNEYHMAGGEPFGVLI